MRKMTGGEIVGSVLKVLLITFGALVLAFVLLVSCLTSAAPGRHLKEMKTHLGEVADFFEANADDFDVLLSIQARLDGDANYSIYGHTVYKYDNINEKYLDEEYLGACADFSEDEKAALSRLSATARSIYLSQKGVAVNCFSEGIDITTSPHGDTDDDETVEKVTAHYCKALDDKWFVELFYRAKG